MELFREAADSFHSGRLVECKERLLAVQLHGFSRLQWYLECNLLACRMQTMLRTAGGGRGLQSLLHSYEQLWQRMTGVAPSHGSMCAELSVVLATCQLLIILLQWSRVKYFISLTLDRVYQVLSPGTPPPLSLPPSLSLSASLSTLLKTLEHDYLGEGAVKCVQKLSVLCALVEGRVEGGEDERVEGRVKGGEDEREEGRVEGGEDEREEEEEGEGKDLVSVAISAHSDWLGGCSPESDYRRAWLQYCHGDYQGALLTLPSSLPPSFHLSPLFHLLSGACYAKQAKLKLALLHWKKCMEVGHTPGHAHFLSALQNCAVVYSESGDTAAATATREMEMKALKCTASSSEPVLPMWVWFDEKVGVVAQPTAHRSLAEAAYCLAWHHLKMKSYKLASVAMGECIAAIENGDVPSPSLPLPSTLHLLHAYITVCSGEGNGRMMCGEDDVGMMGGEDAVRRGKVMCEELLRSPSPTAAPLWRSEVTCLLATACLYLGESAQSRKWSLKCLETVEGAIVEVTGSSCPLTHLLQQHAQLLLALVAIAHAQWREALQLLGGVVATPTGLYNHCLLQCHVGVVMGGASGWVKERRGRVPVGKAEARQWLQDSRKLLQEHRTSGSEESDEMQLVAMDAAMLGLWLKHTR